MATDCEQVKTLFEIALVLRGEQLDAFLGMLEPPLREEVESLLASHDEAESYPEKSPPVDVTPSSEQPDEESVTLIRTPGSTVGKRLPQMSGDYVGDYRILREIGHGGMGVVYEAEQQHPRRSVALKVIRGERFLDEYHVRLFQREAAALARLKHPGIASIHEAGQTAEGQHFFAMELVSGEPLSKYLDKRPKDTSRKKELNFRLELFVKICEAVNYAHQRGVIHRDLKPSNILVGEESESGSGSSLGGSPQVKILDFGLARITDPEVADITSMTAMGRIQGTLAYMSPEQAKGVPEDIDVRTDVYSLGVVLYEMVTDQKPYHVDRTAPLEALRVICHQPPKRPSQMLKDTGRQLDPDIETILLKALEKDPSERYQSTLALAEDIERYLTDRPILAHPPSTMYQLRKAIARHRVGFGFAAALLLLVVALAVVMSVQSARIARERDRAEQEAAKSKAVTDFLQETLGSADPYGGLGRDATVVEALAEATGKIEKSFQNQPELQAALQNTIGYTYTELGRYEEAEPLLRSALAIRTAVLGREHVDVAETLFHLGLIGLERDDPERRDKEAADEHFAEALAIYRKLLGEESLEAADVLNALGVLRSNAADDEKAEALYRESLEIRRRLLAEDTLEVSQSLSNLSICLQRKGDLDEAEPLQREALAIRRKLQGNDHPEVAHSLETLAFFVTLRGHFDEAQRLYTEAIGIYEKTLDASDWHLASARAKYGSLLTRLGHFEMAEELLVAAYPVMLSAHGAQGFFTQRTVYRLIELYDTWGKPEKAAEYRAMLEEK